MGRSWDFPRAGSPPRRWPPSWPDRATGQDVLVTVQEQGGRLRTMLNPNDHLILAPVGNDEAWDAILGTRARAPYPRIASNDE